MDFLFQAIGIIAMIFNVLSYQGKNAKQIILLQFVSSIFFVANFFYLEAYTGALLNLFAIIRALFLFKFKKPPKFTLIFFFIAILILYALTFIAFNKEPITKNFLIELLPTIAMCVQTTALFSNNSNLIRYASYFVSPCWLTYNSICFSLGGILCESFALVSITVGIIRYRKKPKGNK